jgi:hypothetical protein
MPVQCIDCKHQKTRQVRLVGCIDYTHYGCLKDIDLVTGERGGTTCKAMRAPGAACAPIGLLFEPRPAPVPVADVIGAAIHRLARAVGLRRG